jgi:RNA polymerase sigma-70 factor (ECF subfamily)
VTAQPLDVLLEKLTCGDTNAVEQVFRTYEPYLRMVVRRHLSPEMRARFDSLDIVQSVWAHMIKRFHQAGRRFADAAHLRSFLVQLTRHRLIDQLRRHRLSLERERPIDGTGLEEWLLADGPQPADVVEADEVWEQLLELCPAQILRLKREGALTGEVAARTGLNEGSVRRILGILSRRLARLRQERP